MGILIFVIVLIFIGECANSFNRYNMDIEDNKFEMTLHNLSSEESILSNLSHVNRSENIYFTKNGYRHLISFGYSMPYVANDLNCTNETNDLYLKIYGDYQRDFSILNRLLINSTSEEKLGNLTFEELNYLNDLTQRVISSYNFVSLIKQFHPDLLSNHAFVSFINTSKELCNWRNVGYLIEELRNKDFIICTCPPCSNELYLKIADYERINVFPSELIIDGSLKNPHSMPNCMRIEYNPKFHSYAEAIWPLSDDNKKVYNFTTMKQLTFWAKGEKGGERAEFYFADRSLSTGVLVLQDIWQKYSINLTKNDLKSVKWSFAYATNVYQNPVGCTVYIDDIKLDDQ